MPLCWARADTAIRNGRAPSDATRSGEAACRRRGKAAIKTEIAQLKSKPDQIESQIALTGGGTHCVKGYRGEGGLECWQGQVAPAKLKQSKKAVHVEWVAQGVS